MEFKGTCHKCGRTGHKKADCKADKKIKFNGTCNFCNNEGHMEKDSFEKEENASKQPKNWKSRMKQSNSKKDMGRSNVEIILTNVAVTSRMKEENEALLTAADIKFPAVYEILKSADI